MIFSSKDPFYRNRRRRKKYLFRVCFMEAPFAGVLRWMITVFSGQTDPVGQTDCCSWTSTGARKIACTLSTQTLLKEKGFFQPVCLRIAFYCSDLADHNASIITPPPSSSLTEACQRWTDWEVVGLPHTLQAFWAARSHIISSPFGRTTCRRSCRHICLRCLVTYSSPQQKYLLQT